MKPTTQRFADPPNTFLDYEPWGKGWGPPPPEQTKQGWINQKQILMSEEYCRQAQERRDEAARLAACA